MGGIRPGAEKMYYVVAFQVLCGFFSAFVAGRKGRSRIVWWLIGALLPVLGVVLSLTAADRGASSAGGPGAGGRRKGRKPKRCCGAYIADCLGCPNFRRQLFEDSPPAARKGYCDFLQKDLFDAAPRPAAKITIEER
jgi:hypothetical protein